MVTTTQQPCASAHVDSSPSLSPSQRRKLAPNVICMFAEDRPPVVNRKRRGRLPKGIAKFDPKAFIKPGQIVEWKHWNTGEFYLAEVEDLPRWVEAAGRGGCRVVDIRFLGEPVWVFGNPWMVLPVDINTLRRPLPDSH